MRLSAALFCILALATALPARAEFDDVISAEMRPGWRMPGGDHMAALHLTLAPGWKTYWRAPGDAGIPPEFSWTGSRNVERVAVIFPTPDVFDQGGMRSVGYEREVLLPLRVAVRRQGGDVRLKGAVELGICKDICLPHRIPIDVVLPKDAGAPDARIAAAMADVPFSASEAAVRGVRCRVDPIPDGLALRAEIDMPSAGGREDVVIEAGNPLVWVADPATTRRGGTLVAETQMLHVSGDAFALDRSRLRLTVLGDRMAVDIRGCAG